MWNWPNIGLIFVMLVPTIGAQEGANDPTDQNAEPKTVRAESVPLAQRPDVQEQMTAGAIRARRLIHLEINATLEAYITAWNEAAPEKLNAVWHGLSLHRKGSVKALVNFRQGAAVTKVIPNRTLREWDIIGSNSRGDIFIETLIELTPSRLDMVAEAVWERALVTLRREGRKLKFFTISLLESGPLEMVEAAHYQFSDSRLRQVAREHMSRQDYDILYQIGFMDGLALTDIHNGTVPDRLILQLDTDPNSPDEHRRGITHGIHIGTQFHKWATENPLVPAAPDQVEKSHE